MVYRLTGKLSHNIFPVTYPNDPDAYRNGTATALYEICTNCDSYLPNIDAKLMGVTFVASYLNHSCEPNIKLSINAAKSGTLLIATTLRAISENEELTVAYVNPNSPVKERQRLLALQHGFQCRCPKCIRELSSEPKQVSKTTNPRIVPPSGPPRIVSRK
jgi:SET domain-containing protein